VAARFSTARPYIPGIFLSERREESVSHPSAEIPLSFLCCAFSFHFRRSPLGILDCVPGRFDIRD